MRIDLTNGTICHGDSLEVLKTFPDNSIDSVVTDPPYGLSFMGKKWDYDVPSVELWKEVLRVLKPGGHALIACGTRTQHRMVCNIEDAGFEVRDVISWVYGSGFPKSLNIGKAIDKIQGNERRVIGNDRSGAKRNYMRDDYKGGIYDLTRGTSPYEGWGTALKPAVEFFTLVRKPISEKNIAESVLKWETGGINIDGCRVGTNDDAGRIVSTEGYFSIDKIGIRVNGGNNLGRFPANFIHDGGDEVVRLFPETISKYSESKSTKATSIFFKEGNINPPNQFIGDQGSAARFFYCAKASPSERNEGLEGMPLGEPPASARSKPAEGRKNALGEPRANHHPTVKPLALMQYLIRLITPPDGVVLDCFAGSGTTGVAAVKERKKYILIEREEEYIKIIEARVKHAESKIDPTLFDEVV